MNVKVMGGLSLGCHTVKLHPFNQAAYAINFRPAPISGPA